MGLIGKFVGAIVLSVGYKLFITWLAELPPLLGRLDIQRSHAGSQDFPRADQVGSECAVSISLRRL
jgi:hypothetical protein